MCVIYFYFITLPVLAQDKYVNVLSYIAKFVFNWLDYYLLSNISISSCSDRFKNDLDPLIASNVQTNHKTDLKSQTTSLLW